VVSNLSWKEGKCTVRREFVAVLFFMEDDAKAFRMKDPSILMQES